MKEYIQNKINELTYFLELIISILLSVAIIAMTIQLAVNVLPGYIEGSELDLEKFLGKIMTIAIAVELIKMLARHTPSTVIEVLVFAISRQLVVGHPAALETLMGVVSLGLLFATRKFLLCKLDDFEKIVYRASQNVKLVNRLSKLNLPLDKGNTLGDLALNKLSEQGRLPGIGSLVEFSDCSLRIDHMKDGKVTRIEIMKSL